MANIKIYGKCPQCAGTGYRSVYNSDIPPIPIEVPCGYCGETGIIEPYGLDSEVIDSILNGLTTIQESLDDFADKAKTKLNNMDDKLDDILGILNP